MNYREKVTVYLHSDRIENCDCGVREWIVQLPVGWRWINARGPAPFGTLADAGTFAQTLFPGHPSVKRSMTADRWEHFKRRSEAMKPLVPSSEPRHRDTPSYTGTGGPR